MFPDYRTVGGGGGWVEMDTQWRPRVPSPHSTHKPRHMVSEILSVARKQQQQVRVLDVGFIITISRYSMCYVQSQLQWPNVVCEQLFLLSCWSRRTVVRC